MDTGNVVNLERLSNTSRYQRESAAAMSAEARLMVERAGRMLAAVAATRSTLAQQRSLIVVWRPAA